MFEEFATVGGDGLIAGTVGGGGGRCGGGGGWWRWGLECSWRCRGGRVRGEGGEEGKEDGEGACWCGWSGLVSLFVFASSDANMSGC